MRVVLNQKKKNTLDDGEQDKINCNCMLELERWKKGPKGGRSSYQIQPAAVTWSYLGESATAAQRCSGVALSTLSWEVCVFSLRPPWVHSGFPGFLLPQSSQVDGCANDRLTLTAPDIKFQTAT